MPIVAAQSRPLLSFIVPAVLPIALLASDLTLQTTPASQTRVVLLGTGNPAADPDRSGPATAIVVNGTPYLVDFGPGVVRRAKAAVVDRGITALEPTKLRVAFVTHLHSDHTVGYPDLIFSPWTIGRRSAARGLRPKGIKAMTAHLLEAYRVDIETRTNPDGNQHDFPDGHKVNAHEIAPASSTRMPTSRSPRSRPSTRWRATAIASTRPIAASSSPATRIRRRRRSRRAGAATC